jgi:hypothetical protein
MVGVYFIEPMPAVVGYIRFSQTVYYGTSGLQKSLTRG